MTFAQRCLSQGLGYLVQNHDVTFKIYCYKQMGDQIV